MEINGKRYRIGAWAKAYVERLLEGEVVRNPTSSLCGRARSYRGKYESSWENALNHVRDAGVEVIYTPGTRGGRNSATWQVKVPCPACGEQKGKGEFADPLRHNTGNELICLRCHREILSQDQDLFCEGESCR